MPSNITVLFLLVLFFVCLSSSGVYAFGAGNIPSFAYMEGRAFRHGDIEDALAELIKKGSGTGFALASMLSKGSKFGGIDIKRVYFGNWLRDYSQAMDIATLKKVPVQTIINLCMVLGFLAHGYATAEFEVTEERLGVYLPTEHIDNPKGYGAGEDPRHYHPKLRGPVEPIELEVDPRTGMKNYIANDTGHWDTSRALVRRTLEQCIHLGRKHRSQGQKQDEYEAYRLLGQALHTLEDFSAHSNFCEIALASMGHQEVFLHVGDQCRIQAPNGKWVAPLVTGTFGGSDFTHSLLGEAGDHLSQASVSDLNKELDKAHSTSRSGGGANPGSVLRDLLFSVPGGGGSEMAREMEGIERIRAGPAQGGKRPEDMTPQELHGILWQVLSFRDSVAKKISHTIEKIPGLGPLIEKIMDSISVFVFTTLEPFLKPLLKTATSQLSTVAAEAINNQDQYEVFNDPRASDPTHSFLSKDHFNLILNEPAGHLARIVLIHTVTLVIKAWDDNSVNVNHLTEDVLSCLFHPDFHNKSSKVQREMMEYMHTWVNGLGARKHSVIQRLSKNAVRNHENVRAAGEGGKPAAEGTFAANQAHQFQSQVAGYATQHIPGAAQAQAMFGGHGHQGPGREMPGGGGGHASSYYEGGGNAPPPQPSYGSPAPPAHGHGSHGPPGHGHGHGSHAPPGAPSFPGEASPYGAPPGPPPSFPGSESSGYNPSYAPPPGGPPSFPGAAPSFPGAPGGYGSPPPPQGGYGGGFPGGPPEFPGTAPGFPGGAPGFPGADPYSSPPPQFPGAQNQYPPPSGPPYGQGQW
ncbi:heterokaryon incompatibility protein Het-C-domain-containing protein [Mycena albidolilacea]|uniref:Heterokaryon incompatibility protein Het-C-domain-containing protein n=1 Tax=Mycena albidolilacea TaxID=1033008 RepID=A0AAD7AI14_9AGAR|nr:heterokaryon incompatibility protein Het-C-domain-containing protein [Mycena albidolilacea]